MITEGAAPRDQAYEKQWAFTLLDHTLALLRQQMLTRDGLEQFDALKEFVWGNPSLRSQFEIAGQLGMTPNAVGVAVYRMRRCYGKLLRAAIAQTVADPTEIDGELRHLIDVVSA